MSRTSLTPVSYLVLGWLAHSPSTPYELKQKVAQSVGNFWSFPHSQLYAEPERLAELGLLEEEQEQTGRRRRIFSITEAGRGALEEWLRESTSETPELRDIGLLKLFFSDPTDKDQVVALARAQEQAHREKLAFYEQLEKIIPPRATPGQLATLRMGLMCERTFIEFWSGLSSED